MIVNRYLYDIVEYFNNFALTFGGLAVNVTYVFSTQIVINPPGAPGITSELKKESKMNQQARITSNRTNRAEPSLLPVIVALIYLIS
ncbi:MAG: hypothetical protein GZ085_02015 [Sulfuriferula multivorans]|uniref:Uncharacterized protein n=1 Tax=Sulfuriferula multivorans TaxID=1559896 RepID=A0A7C9NT59_9PROT|nr:hypothetical protein [Sulfuriferula multivorans]